jgi:hypothetical protein
MKETALLYISSDAIENYCANHPLEWPERSVANGEGNVLTPTPAIAVFFRLLTKTGDLFTQQAYLSFAWQEWAESRHKFTQAQIDGLGARLYRNFYPSAIDSLHVWALLVETGRFDKCVIDTVADAVGKTDITVWPTLNGNPLRIALYTDNPYSRARTEYKREFRGAAPRGTIDVTLKMDRPKQPGNKRWYNQADLTPIFNALRGQLGATTGPAFAIGGN